MKNLNRSLRVFVLTMCALTFIVANGYGQIRLDVKTKWTEKNKLSLVKHALLAAIDETEWVSATEFGEDYSLWLKGLTRNKRGDTLIVSFDIELRTPTLLGNGDLLAAKESELRYTPDDIEELRDSDERSEVILNHLEQQKNLQSVLVNGAVTLIPIPAILKGVISAVLNSVMTELNREPTERELYEASLIAITMLLDTDSMLAEISQ